MKKLTYLLVLALAPACLFICCNNTAGNTGNAGAAESSAGAVSGSGGDLYFEHSITGGGKDMTMNGYTKMYWSAEGKIRMEMDMGMTMANAKDNKIARKMGGPMIILGDTKKLDESISIDDEKKTYTVNHIDLGDKADNSGMKSVSVVQKMGDESILGYHCVHARVISSKSMGAFYHSKDTMDVWQSTDVPMAAVYQQWMDRHKNQGIGMFDASAQSQLKAMGCQGFLVKMQNRSERTNMTMVLTKVDHRSIPSAMFDIPAGYKEEKE